MPQRKKRTTSSTRKKKDFKCPKCSFRTTGPTRLGEHYQKNPTHATKRSTVMNGRTPLPTVSSGVRVPRSQRQMQAVIARLEDKRASIDQAIAALKELAQ